MKVTLMLAEVAVTQMKRKRPPRREVIVGRARAKVSRGAPGYDESESTAGSGMEGAERLWYWYEMVPL